MKRFAHFVVMASAILLISCSFEDSIKITSKEIQDDSPIFYHSGLQMYLQKSNKEVTTKSFSSSENTTHIAVKFYPNSIEQQIMLANKPDASISYTPFGYELISSNIKTKSSIPEYPEKNPHSIQCDGPVIADRIEGIHTNTELSYIKREIFLPIMYAYWPIEEPLPDDVDYTIIDTVSLSNDIGSITMMGFPLRLTTYDSLLGTEVPLRNVKVRATFNSLSIDRYTNTDGYILISPRVDGLSNNDIRNGTITLILESNNWTITSGNATTTPIHIPLGCVKFLWSITNPSQRDYSLSSEVYEIEAHRAIDYYFNSEHSLSEGITPYDSGTLIHIMPEADDEYLGLAWPDDKVIELYNSGYPQSKFISTLFHEQGHIRHYGKADSFSQIASIIKESYASFIGWVIGEEYYISKGYIKPSPSYEINQQGRQNWNIYSELYNYSPLFVDLIDNYNQHTTSSIYVNDLISNTPFSVVENMALESHNLVECFDYLENYVGTYFSQNDLNLMKQYYEE